MVHCRTGLIVLLAFSSRPVGAADDTPPVDGDEMRRHASLVRVESLSGGQPARVEMLPGALLRHSDPTRNIADGSLWAFGGPGRPRAILEVEDYVRRPDAVRWMHGLVSLSPGLIAATWDDGRRWESTQPGLILSPIPDAPAPAATDRERSRQMKELARGFDLREGTRPDKVNIQLRLLTSPVHRYSDPGSGLQDGAIFVFALGTNPEALLIIEARPAGDSAPAWQYGLARSTGGVLSASLNGREVWDQPLANPPHTGAAYVNRRHPVLAGSR
jgi:hypothetical protein